MWWCVPLIPAQKRRKQEVQNFLHILDSLLRQFKDSLGYGDPAFEDKGVREKVFAQNKQQQ